MRPLDHVASIARATVGVGVGVAVLLLLFLFLPGVVRAEGKDLDGVVNLNTASADLLQLLPGIGPAKVRSIYWYRQRHPFRTVDELVRIKGIGRKMVRHLRRHLAVSGPSTARAVRRPTPPLEPPPAPAAPAPPTRVAIKRPPVPVAPMAGPMAGPIGRPIGRPAIPRGRPPPSAARDRRSLANHCPRPR